MKHVQWGTPAPCRVTATFQNDSAFFELPPAATFGDLAVRVGHLAQRKHRALIGLKVKVAAQRSAASAHRAGTSKAGMR